MRHTPQGPSPSSPTRKPRFVGLAALSVLAAFACNSTGDRSTPLAVAQTVIAALDSGDPTGFIDALPSESDLVATFDCGRNHLLRAAVQRRREDAPAEFAARRQAGHRVRLVHFDRPGSSTTTLELGDMFHGCSVKTPVTVHRSQIELSLSKSGRLDVDTETWTFLRFTPDGPWTFAKL